MDQEETEAPDTLSDYVTIKEAAQALGLEMSSIRRMVGEGLFISRSATFAEQAMLLQEKRIKGVPGTGIRLLSRHSVASVKSRRKPPKEHSNQL